MGYIIIRAQVDGVGSYDEDQIALIILDSFKFDTGVPVTLGTPKIRRVVNVIKERNFNVLATPWVNTQVTYLLAGHRANTSSVDEKVAKWPMDPTDTNEIMKTKRSEKIEGFSSKVIHTGTMTMFMGYNLHAMMHALCEGDKPIPHGLAVQNMYAEMMIGSKGIAVVVWTLTATPIMLKKNAPLARVVVGNTVPITQVLLGTVEQMNAAQRIQTADQR